MNRVLLIVEHPENRRLLTSFLAHHYEVVSPEAVAGRGASFDLGIVDVPSLERLGSWVDAIKRAAHPVFLPFLVVAQRRGVRPMTAWEHVDELIATPVEKTELLARVENLLRGRVLSLANAALRRRLEAELERARVVQCSLLPQCAPHLEDFDLAARCVPAREVGGDFYDWRADHGDIVLSVGDVMGKGVPAALLAATVRAVLRALAHQNPPSVALDLLRETLAGDLERTSSFVTLFHAQLDPAKHEIHYVDAGHGHAVIRRNEGSLEPLERGGRPVGFPVASPYRESTVRLNAGDVFIVYSDGLCEGGVDACEGIRPDALADVTIDTPAATIVDRLIARAPKADFVDDITVLALKCVH